MNPHAFVFCPRSEPPPSPMPNQKFQVRPEVRNEFSAPQTRFLRLDSLLLECSELVVQGLGAEPTGSPAVAGHEAG